METLEHTELHSDASKFGMNHVQRSAPCTNSSSICFVHNERHCSWLLGDEFDGTRAGFWRDLQQILWWRHRLVSSRQATGFFLSSYGDNCRIERKRSSIQSSESVRWVIRYVRGCSWGSTRDVDVRIRVSRTSGRFSGTIQSVFRWRGRH